MKKIFFKRLVAFILTLSLLLTTSPFISALETPPADNQNISAQRLSDTTFFIRKVNSNLKSETILFENSKAIQISIYDILNENILSIDLEKSSKEEIDDFISKSELASLTLTKDFFVNESYRKFIDSSSYTSNAILTRAYYSQNIWNEPMTDDGLTDSGLGDGFKLLGNALNVSGNYGATIYRKLDQKYLGKEKELTFEKGELLVDVVNIIATFLDPTMTAKALLVLDIVNKAISYRQSVGFDSFSFFYDYKIHAGTGDNRYSYKLALTAYRNKKYHKVYNQTNGKLQWILKMEESLPVGTNYDWINAAINNRQRGIVGGYK